MISLNKLHSCVQQRLDQIWTTEHLYTLTDLLLNQRSQLKLVVDCSLWDALIVKEERNSNTTYLGWSVPTPSAGAASVLQVRRWNMTQEVKCEWRVVWETTPTGFQVLQQEKIFNLLSGWSGGEETEIWCLLQQQKVELVRHEHLWPDVLKRKDLFTAFHSGQINAAVSDFAEKQIWTSASETQTETQLVL